MSIKQGLSYCIKRLCPPALYDLLFLDRKYGWFGDFKSWDDAKKNTTGYDSEIILKKVKGSLFKVKRGEAVYERDSVIFNEPMYSWPLLASLLWIIVRSNNILNIMDFGGSLGSSYFQNRTFFSNISSFHWNIVEQASFVECGKEHFESSELKFYYSIGDCLKEQTPNAVLFSGVLQYLERPDCIINEILDTNIPYILIDLTPFVHHGKKRIVTQKVNPEIYDASYPAWFFNENDFVRQFNERYDCVYSFNSILGEKLIVDGIDVGRYKGYLFAKKGL